ncbi:MAG: GFA family protein [Rhodospirillaceae bacterium]|nr:GFA family protein [Rhodospirillaceae bacterium]
MKVEGQCHCGQIAYTAEVDPAKVTLCHCVDCQILSGGPYIATVAANAGTFKLLYGEVHHYVKTAESGRKRLHGLCTICGTRLYAASSDEPRAYSLRTGPLKQRNDLKPSRRIWCDSAQAWSINLSDIEQVARQPG